ncbi:MAG TPA: PD-(D/E)XK nuclease family protein [Spirillospora sp.]|nr:PD-(D/E)XK nuclease family protein [Spirillospora sp.]
MASPNWALPDGVRGEADVIRLSATALDQSDRSCPHRTALKARPKVWPLERRRYSPWVDFPLGLVKEALDEVEFQGAGVRDAVQRVVARSRSTVHPGAATWVSHACDAYLRAGEWIDAELEPEGIALRPEPLPRIVQHRSAAELRMLTAWGRWYESEDGRVREFRRLRIGRAGERGAPSNDALAFVTASGRRARGNVYRDVPVPVVADAREPERVRVVEVVLSGDAPPRVVVDAAPDDIRRSYRERARGIVADVVFADAKRPGADCADCKTLRSCDAIPSAPGLLGVQAKGTHRRAWSVTTGRQYLVCPAQAHLRELRLPMASWSDGEAARRGRAVHRWLEAAHGRPGARACDHTDLPEPDAPDLGVAGKIMTAEEYAEARPYLLAHLAVCPLGGAEPLSGVMPEPSVAAYDPAADVVVIAAPDLVRTVGGRLVYREQKTTDGPLPGGDAERLFARFPQLALAVRLIAHGVLGGDGTGVVELETMTRTGAEVRAFEVSEPEVQDAARQVIVRMTRRWRTDVEFRANPGHWCRGCPVAQWCPDRAPADPAAPIVVDGVRIDPVTGEVLNAAGALTDRAAAVSEGLAEPVQIEEPPF